MEANELRVGNYLKMKNTRSILVCLGVFPTIDTSILSIQYKEYNVHGGKFQHYKCSAFEGIPLTEEWLLKLGFEKSTIYNNTYFLSIETLNGVHDIFIDINANVVLLETIEVGEFKYVHQLQNLYFALTGEELIIK